MSIAMCRTLSCPNQKGFGDSCRNDEGTRGTNELLGVRDRTGAIRTIVRGSWKSVAEQKPGLQTRTLIDSALHASSESDRPGKHVLRANTPAALPETSFYR